MALAASERDEFDFALVLNFPRGDTHPTRIFKVAVSLINEFADFDRELARGVDRRMTSVLQLERVEEGSLKVWLRTALNTVEDDALKSGDWKKVVGNWLFLAKKRVLEYLDREGGAATIDVTSLEDLRTAIQVDGKTEELGRLTPVVLPPRVYFVYLIYRISTAVAELGPGESATFEDFNGDLLTIRPNRALTSEAADEIAIASSEVIDSDLVLPIKKPDFIGDSRWEFILGTHAIEAKMLDLEWLSDFRSQKIPILPGSSLSVKLRQVLARALRTNISL